METDRRLAAIMLTDIVGYSKKMNIDESLALKALEHHNGLLFPIIGASRGRVVKTEGDGILAEFQSVVQAVQCALAIQSALENSNKGLPEDERILVRIGIHVGDVVIKADGDVLGEGVNIAARIQPLAEPGGICVTSAVHSQIKNMPEFVSVSLGQQKLKNISEPIEVLCIQPASKSPCSGRDTLPGDPRKKEHSASSITSLARPTTKPVDYSPALLESWEKNLSDGRWTHDIDCRDGVLLQDLCAVLREVLGQHGIAETSKTHAEVALMELCRNVAAHAASPHGQVDIAISFKFMRFSLTVHSAGEPFTLEQALSKHSHLPPAQRRVHGMQNLLGRGHFSIERDGNFNKAQFNCALVLAQTGSQARFSVVLNGLTLRVEQNVYGMTQWTQLAALDGGTQKLKDSLLADWRDPSAVRILATINPPAWTLDEEEVACLESMGDFIKELKADQRFQVEQIGPPREWAQQWTRAADWF